MGGTLSLRESAAFVAPPARNISLKGLVYIFEIYGAYPFQDEFFFKQTFPSIMGDVDFQRDFVRFHPRLVWYCQF